MLGAGVAVMVGVVWLGVGPAAVGSPADGVPAGMLAAATPPAAALQAGMVPAAVVAAGMRPAGALPAAALPAGMVPATAHPAGMLPTGMRQAGGALPAGTRRGGALPAGAPPAAVHPGALLPDAAVPAAESGGVWSWPLPSPQIVATYVAPATVYSAGHRGIDLGAVPGAPVSAPDEAVVRFSGVVVDRPVITLDHGGGVLSSYEPVEGLVPVGTPVARGAVLGNVATGGHCDGSCLHVGVRIDGQYVSPLLFFGRVPPAVLLPLGSG